MQGDITHSDDGGSRSDRMAPSVLITVCIFKDFTVMTLSYQIERHGKHDSGFIAQPLAPRRRDAIPTEQQSMDETSAGSEVLR